MVLFMFYAWGQAEDVQYLMECFRNTVFIKWKVHTLNSDHVIIADICQCDLMRICTEKVHILTFSQVLKRTTLTHVNVQY